MVVLGGVAVSYERGTPVHPPPIDLLNLVGFQECILLKAHPHTFDRLTAKIGRPPLSPWRQPRGKS